MAGHQFTATVGKTAPAERRVLERMGTGRVSSICEIVDADSHELFQRQ
jgi:hypothetical protein